MKAKIVEYLKRRITKTREQGLSGAAYVLERAVAVLCDQKDDVTLDGSVLISSNDEGGNSLSLVIWDKDSTCDGVPFGWAVVAGRPSEVRHFAKKIAEQRDTPNIVAVTDFLSMVGRAALFAVENVSPENVETVLSTPKKVTMAENG